MFYHPLVEKNDRNAWCNIENKCKKHYVDSAPGFIKVEATGFDVGAILMLGIFVNRHDDKWQAGNQCHDPHEAHHLNGGCVTGRPVFTNGKVSFDAQGNDG